MVKMEALHANASGSFSLPSLVSFINIFSMKSLAGIDLSSANLIIEFKTCDLSPFFNKFIDNASSMAITTLGSFSIANRFSRGIMYSAF